MHPLLTAHQSDTRTTVLGVSSGFYSGREGCQELAIHSFMLGKPQDAVGIRPPDFVFIVM